MSSMDGDIKKDILDVRKVIERSTSKVSLRDLEKKGFRKVKVLRAGDINQLIYKAVQTVLAKQPAGMGEAERQQVLAEAKAEYERQTKQLQELQEAQDRVEQEKQQIEQAKANLEQKLAQVNAQLVAEKKRLEAEKAQVEREKATISEKGFDAIQTAQKQAADLQQRLIDAERRAAQAVPLEQYNQLREEARTRVVELEQRLKEAEAAQAKAVENGEVEKLRLEMQARDAQQAQMFQELMGALKTGGGGGGGGGDIDKQLKAMQQNLVDTMRKFAGSGMKGFEESQVDIGTLLAAQADIQVETNIKDVNVKQQSAQGVKDKLSKLRNMRGGGPK